VISLAKKKQKKVSYKIILLAVFLLIVVSCWVSSKIYSSKEPYEPTKTREPAIRTFTLNVCERDPANANQWRQMGVNLLDYPDGKLVYNIPACSNIKLELLQEKYLSDYGLTFQKVRYGNKVGWQTKRLLEFAPEGEE